jgi:hypothetical protein
VLVVVVVAGGRVTVVGVGEDAGRSVETGRHMTTNCQRVARISGDAWVCDDVDDGTSG